MLRTVARQFSPDSILAEMGIDIAVNAEGQVMILHEKAFASPIASLDYDQMSRSLSFVFEDGSVRDFGMEVPKNAAPKLALTHKAKFYRVENEKIVSAVEAVVNQVQS